MLHGDVEPDDAAVAPPDQRYLVHLEIIKQRQIVRRQHSADPDEGNRRGSSMIPQTQKPKPKTFASLTPGDPAPWFHQRSGGNPNYAFDTVGGRWIVMCFYGSAGDEDGKRALAAIA